MPTFLKHFIQKDRHLYATEFGHSRHANPKTVGPWSREMYILHFVVRGYCDFSGFRAEAGQAFLIAKGQLHSFAISHDYEHYWIGIAGDAIEEIFASFQIRCHSHQLFFVENADYLKGLFSATLETLRGPDPEAADSLVLSVFSAMLPLLQSEKLSPMPQKINYAEKVRIFIEANYIYPIKMAHIAEEIHLSEKYMYRLFLNRYGLSPQRFLLQTRMENAGHLLTQEQLSVKEVAYTVGYTSLPAFSKAFTGYFGVSPLAYRNQQQKTGG